MAIRWASDRIDKQGVIAFVTNGSWIDGNVDSGIRACLAEEFSSVHVLHLRGNQRTSGERFGAEGWKGIRQRFTRPVAITIFVKNPNATHDGCKIHYRDIGDYLTREQKLDALTEAVSIKGISDWQTITPNNITIGLDNAAKRLLSSIHSDRRTQRQAKQTMRYLGYIHQGLATTRDAYIYNFSRDACAENAQRMTQDYLAALSELKENPELTVDEVARRHTRILSGIENSRTI